MVEAVSAIENAEKVLARIEGSPPFAAVAEALSTILALLNAAPSEVERVAKSLDVFERLLALPSEKKRVREATTLLRAQAAKIADLEDMAAVGESLRAELARHTAPVTDSEVAGLVNCLRISRAEGDTLRWKATALIERLHRQNAPVSDGERAALIKRGMDMGSSGWLVHERWKYDVIRALESDARRDAELRAKIEAMLADPKGLRREAVEALLPAPERDDAEQGGER